MLISEALVWAAESLGAGGIADPRLDGEVLIAEVVGCDRAFLFAHPELPLSPRDQELFRVWIRRRARGLPAAYILGRKEFWSLDYRVTPAVLIPRPETEFLVQACLERAKGETVQQVAEVGCGSGAVVITLAREWTRARFYALDSSRDALWVARQNARGHGVEGRITFLRGDLLGPLQQRSPAGKLDQVIANPPYVPRGRIPRLAPDVRLYEPRRALDGGRDGLAITRRLIPQAEALLKPGGWLILEMGEGQHEGIARLLRKGRAFEEIEIQKDYRGTERVIAARRGNRRNRGRRCKAS